MGNNEIKNPVETINAEDLEELEKKIYDLKNLIGLGISLSSNLEFESLVESVLYSCIGRMIIDKIAILLEPDIDSDNFVVHMSKGYDDENILKTLVINENSPIINYLKINTIPLEFDSLKEFPDLINDMEKMNILYPKLIVPMKSKNIFNGILVLGEKYNGEDYTVNEKEFMLDLGKFAAIAVENSRLYQMATMDRMTKLFIHHYFHERLTEEIRRANKDNTPISMIMLDIDHFKFFNDNYGHQQGDTVLKETAGIIKKLVRNMDIAARYGGEEFSIILPKTELEDAIHAANRIRKEIEHHEYPGQTDPLHITVSLGVAQYNVKIDKENKDFIERADRALYKAKMSGRNKVVAHKENLHTGE